MKNTIVLPPRYNSDTQRMWRTATATGWNVVRANGWRVDSNTITGHTVVYGESLFVVAVCDQLGLTAKAPELDWLSSLSITLTHRRIGFGTMSVALELDGYPWFIKPADEKAFPAKVYDGASELAEHPADRMTSSLWSEPVHFDSEFRCFCVGREVRTLSVYSRHGEIAGDDQDGYPASDEELLAAKTFAVSVLQAHQFEFGVVIDVGLLSTGEWAVVEANPCWASGMYGCSTELVLGVLQTAFVAG